MASEELNQIFDSIYKGDKDSLEMAILELRKSNATQMETVNLLKKKLSLSLGEADKLIMNSSIWRDMKPENLELRKGFERTFDESSTLDELNPDSKILWEESKPKLNLLRRILRKLGI